MSIRAVLSDREQWSLFLGHMVLGLLVLGPVLYFATSAVAENEAQEAAAKVELKLDAVKAQIQAVTVQQTATATKLESVDTGVEHVRTELRSVSDKLDRLIERGGNGGGGGYR